MFYYANTLVRGELMPSKGSDVGLLHAWNHALEWDRAHHSRGMADFFLHGGTEFGGRSDAKPRRRVAQ